MRVYVATTVAVQTQAGANYFQAAYLGTGIGYVSGTNTYNGVAQIQSAAPLTVPVIKDSTGTEIAKFAWAFVYFDGTTTPPTIYRSFNVSSVTRNSTGSFNVNLNNSLPTAYASTVASARNIGVGQGIVGAVAVSVSVIDVLTVNASFAVTNLAAVSVAVFI
jgi:hypothetical protein